MDLEAVHLLLFCPSLLRRGLNQIRISTKEMFFFQIPLAIQEDLECGVCTSGSSCERGWGATVDPAALNVKLGPRQPGVSFLFFCTFSSICLQTGDALDDEQRRELPPELLRLLRLQRKPFSCLTLLDNRE